MRRRSPRHRLAQKVLKKARPLYGAGIILCNVPPKFTTNISPASNSANETTDRPLLTAGTTFLTAVALFVFGGRVINDFAFMFLVGVITGTFSSIYIASPIVLWAHRTELGKPKKAGGAAAPANA